MRTCLSWLSAAVAVLVLTGCIDSSTVFQVNKDGSGAILVREFISIEAMSMLDGFNTMDADTVDAEDDMEGVSELPTFLQSAVRERAGEFGDNVRLTAVQAATNDRGWQGYMARFEFDDVNEVRFTTGMSGENDDTDETEYQISFTPGETAELRLVPRQPETMATEEPVTEMAEMDEMGMEGDTEEMDMDLDTEFGDMTEGMGDAMGEMFAGMLKGVRMSMFVDVEGEIVETDALHRSETRPNRIALVDVDFDELMEHPDAMNRLMNNDPQAIFELQEEGAPGLLMEDPEKALTIRFR